MHVRLGALALSALVALAALPAVAADFQVKMLNQGPGGEMVFDPILTKVAKGDTITFIPTDKGHHVATIDTLMPAGAASFQSTANQELKVTFDTEGAYVLKCPPHFGMGMVAVVIVGPTPPANLDAVKTGKLPKKARDRVDAALTAAGL